jgi:hypothetical protein
MQRSFEQAGLSARIFPLNISQSGASVVENRAFFKHDPALAPVDGKLVS